MKTEDNSTQAQTAHLSEGMRLIFDQESPSSSASTRSRSSSSRGSCSSHSSHSPRGLRRSAKRVPRHGSPSSGVSTHSSPPRTRSRSRPRCHRASSHSCRRRHSPPRQERSRSPSSPSPDRSSRRVHHRAPPRRYRANSRSYSPSPPAVRSSRGGRRSRSPGHRRVQRVVGRRGSSRPSGSPRRRSPRRSYRSRSRSSERSASRLSRDDKRELLKINATETLGGEQLELLARLTTELPAEQEEEGLVSLSPALSEKSEESVSDEWVRPDPVRQKSPTQQDKGTTSEDDEPSPRMSPKRKLITFSINNSVAKPTCGVSFHIKDTKVTSRMDSVDSRKPYGHWVAVKKTGSSSSRPKLSLSTWR